DPGTLRHPRGQGRAAPAHAPAPGLCRSHRHHRARRPLRRAPHTRRGRGRRRAPLRAREGIMNQPEQYELVEVDCCACSTATPKALLVVCDGKEVWIPASQVDDASEVYQPGTDGTLVIPRWIAEMKELPYRETRSLR